MIDGINPFTPANHMATIHPFRAFRPAPDVAARVAAVPYDVVTTLEARRLADAEPLSFLKVLRAEIDLPSTENPYAQSVYNRAVQNFETLTQAGRYTFEAESSLYCYQLTTATHEQTGVAMCCSLDEYEDGLVKKHEHTRRDKEDDRTRHMLALGAQTGTVFLTYRALTTIDDLVDRTCEEGPIYDFEASDNVRHRLWRVSSELKKEIVHEFRSVPALYIADGHHRVASAARARVELRKKGMSMGNGGSMARHDVFLAVAFPDQQVQVLPYNRTVRDLAGMNVEEVLARLRSKYVVRPGLPMPTCRGNVSMYLGGEWHVISLNVAENEEPKDKRVARLDVARLQENILEPLLKVVDVRTDPRVEFVGGSRGIVELEARVESGQAAIAFSLHPVDLEDLMTIADAGGMMPPKSTWFEPKLRDGLLIHMIK